MRPDLTGDKLPVTQGGRHNLCPISAGGNHLGALPAVTDTATDISLADFTDASMIRSGMGFVLAAYTSFREADLTGADLWQLKAYRCDFA